MSQNINDFSPYMENDSFIDRNYTKASSGSLLSLFGDNNTLTLLIIGVGLYLLCTNQNKLKTYNDSLNWTLIILVAVLLFGDKLLEGGKNH